MIKTLKVFKNAFRQRTNSKLESRLSSPSMTMLIKLNSKTIFFVAFFLSFLIFLEILLYKKKWVSYLILSCFLVILSLFLGIRLLLRLFKMKESSLGILYNLFLSICATLIIICLIARFLGIEMSSLQDLNNEKSSLFFQVLVLNSFYSHLISLIKPGKYQILLTASHKIILMSAILITIKLDGFYYFQNIFFELVSFSLLISTTRSSQTNSNNNPTFNTEPPKPPELTRKVSNHNEWKAMVNEFPIGVVILSLDKKVTFSNKTVHDMFELVVNKTSFVAGFMDKEKELDVSIALIKEPSGNTMTNSKNNNLKATKEKVPKVSFDELNQKIGRLEEVEDKILNDIGSSLGKSHSFSSSNELSIKTHSNKSIRHKRPFLYHFNSMNPNHHSHNINNTCNSFRSRNSRHSYSILSSIIIHEKEREQQKALIHKNSGMKSFKDGRKYQTEKVLETREKEEKTFAKTKAVKVKNKNKGSELDQIIFDLINKNNIEINEKDEINGLQGVKTYCTQYKNFKKSDDIKKKYQLKIQRIFYKQHESFLILIEDVSYMDSIAHLRENNEYKNKIMTTLSHEITTPLNGAIPALEDVVSNLEDDSPLKDELIIPLKSLYLLQNVLGDAVDFALINSNQLYLNYEEGNIFEFLKETVEIFSIQADFKNIDLSFQFEEGKFPPKKVIADFQRVRQILVSLLGNSMKNTSKGSIEIKVEVGPEDSPKISQKTTKNSNKTEKNPVLRKRDSDDPSNETQEKIIMKFIVKDEGFGIDPFKLLNIKTCLKEKNPLEVCNNLDKEVGCGLGLIISHCLALILGPRNNHGLDIDSTLNYGTKTAFFIEFYVERKPYQDYVKALSTIRETKEMTKYSTKRKIDGMGTQSKCNMTRYLTGNSNFFPSNFNITKKIVKSASYELDKLTSKSKTTSQKKKCLSQNNTPNNSSRMIRSAEMNSVGNESVEFTLYQQSHQFNTLNFESLFIGKVNSGRKKSPDKVLNNCSSKSSFSHHFEEILNSNCTCEEALIVDDDAFNLKSLELLLSKFQRKCVKAYNGEEAIKIVQDKYQNGLCGDHCNGFKIIFMDYHMPIKNGVETTKFLKGLMDLNELPTIPIIACTAFGAKDLVEEWEKAGMTQFVTKPITAKKIEAIVDEYL